MFSFCNPQSCAIRHIHHLVIPSSDHNGTETAASPGDHFFTETVAPSSDHYCIDMVVSSSDHCNIETVAPPMKHILVSVGLKELAVRFSSRSFTRHEIGLASC